ncbi:MAG: hypothetical protein JWL93_1967 [Hyphomicrobiales bacterium]|nr:hypothetical protein [Hyphomicrobiales bacterium]
MTIPSGRLFDDQPPDASAEICHDLVARPGLRIERIVSTGQATPPGAWLQQDRAEWVVLLSGSAGLQFEGEETERSLAPGDWLEIEPGLRHRVEWTAADEPSVWLAVHFVQEAQEMGPQYGLATEA